MQYVLHAEHSMQTKTEQWKWFCAHHIKISHSNYILRLAILLYPVQMLHRSSHWAIFSLLRHTYIICHTCTNASQAVYKMHVTVFVLLLLLIASLYSSVYYRTTVMFFAFLNNLRMDSVISASLCSRYHKQNYRQKEINVSGKETFTVCADSGWCVLLLLPRQDLLIEFHLLSQQGKDGILLLYEKDLWCYCIALKPCCSCIVSWQLTVIKLHTRQRVLNYQNAGCT